MDDKPRHEAFSYASAGELEPAEEFPILYRLLTAERKSTGSSSTTAKRHFDNNNNRTNYQLNITSNHSYFPIICRSSRNNRKLKTQLNNSSTEKESLTLSKVEADSTSDISLTHILARNKFNIQPQPPGRKSRTSNSRKGRKNLRNLKDVSNEDEMIPSSTTNDDEDIDEYLQRYYYSSRRGCGSPPRKRARFPQSMKRALILRRTLLQGKEDELEEGQDDDQMEERREESESILVSNLSVNERLAVLLGQQQQQQPVNENNSIETKPPSLVVPQRSANNDNIFCNNTHQSASNSNVNNNLPKESRAGEGALRTLLSRPPTTSLSPAASSRKLVFPPHSPNQNLIPNALHAFPGKTPNHDEEDKKVLIKDVVHQLRAAATQRLNSLFSFKRSFTGRANNSNSLGFEEGSGVLQKCPPCDLTFKTEKPQSQKILHTEKCFDVNSWSWTSAADAMTTPAEEDAKNSPSTSSSPSTKPKQYMGLSELLETKVEDAPPPLSVFHSFVLPKN